MNWFQKIFTTIYNIPIIDYSHQQVYCKGYFRRPTKEEIKAHSKKPLRIFHPIENHGWCVSFYTKMEVESWKRKSK